MTQYIDKSAVVAEIDRRLADNRKEIERASHKNLEDYFEGYEDGLTLLKQQFLDTLEMKDAVAEQEGICNGILNTIIGDTWHIKIPLNKAGLKHGDKVKIFITKEK